MNDDDLKKLWQQQPLRKPDVSPEQLVSAMHKQTRQLRRTLLVRDVRELVACALVIIVFGIFYFTVYVTPVSRVGDLIVIGSTIFIAWKIIHTRRTTPPAPPGATVVESLQANLVLRHLAGLLNHQNVERNRPAGEPDAIAPNRRKTGSRWR